MPWAVPNLLLSIGIVDQPPCKNTEKIWESELKALEARGQLLNSEKEEVAKELASLSQEVARHTSKNNREGQHCLTALLKELKNECVTQRRIQSISEHDCTEEQQPATPRVQSLSRDDEVIKLMEENLKLREALHEEKKKVIELQFAAYSNVSASKKELSKIFEKFTIIQNQEQEVAQLRLEQFHFRKELLRMAGFEVDAAGEVKKTQQTNTDVQQDTPGWAAELEVVSKNVFDQLIVLEDELAQQVKTNSTILTNLKHFIDNVYRPLGALHEICEEVIIAGHAGTEMQACEQPPYFDPDTFELHECLDNIVCNVGFFVQTFEAMRNKLDAKWAGGYIW